MTHEELLAKIDSLNDSCSVADRLATSLRAVVKLHYEHIGGAERAVYCYECTTRYPCPTIQAIEKELEVSNQLGEDW